MGRGYGRVSPTPGGIRPLQNASAGHSEEEALSLLRGHIANSTELAEGFRADLEGALVDKRYSWKEAFAKNDVFVFEDEEQAYAYAQSLLWDSLFGT